MNGFPYSPDLHPDADPRENQAPNIGHLEKSGPRFKNNEKRERNEVESGLAIYYLKGVSNRGPRFSYREGDVMRG